MLSTISFLATVGVAVALPGWGSSESSADTTTGLEGYSSATSEHWESTTTPATTSHETASWGYSPSHSPSSSESAHSMESWSSPASESWSSSDSASSYPTHSWKSTDTIETTTTQDSTVYTTLTTCPITTTEGTKVVTKLTTSWATVTSCKGGCHPTATPTTETISLTTYETKTTCPYTWTSGTETKTKMTTSMATVTSCVWGCENEGWTWYPESTPSTTEYQPQTPPAHPTDNGGCPAPSTVTVYQTETSCDWKPSMTHTETVYTCKPSSASSSYTSSAKSSYGWGKPEESTTSEKTIATTSTESAKSSGWAGGW